MKGSPEHAGRHLLVVDDDNRIRELLKAYLARSGFRVTTAADAAQAERLMQTLGFDLMVLDVMMPGEDGISFARRLRSGAGAMSKTPVLILTARGLADERIDGLKAGADDYLAKPFEPEELLLRIEAILRRTVPPEPAPEAVQLGACRFDLARGELSRDGEIVRITEAEGQLLRTLALALGEPVDRYDLAAEGDAGGRAVDVQVTRLRRKLEADPKAPRYLLTVRGVGYRLAPGE